MGNVLRNVRIDLEEGKTVLFSGTACQINGLKKYIKKDYENLITVDVICHGTPSPLLWKKYVEYREIKLGRKIEHVCFRCKDDGWTAFGLKVNGEYFSKELDPFMQMFLRNYSLRPSCYNCKAKNNKMSDITLADFWGIELCTPEMHDDKGTSLVIVRTKKGEEIFERINEQLNTKQVQYEDGVRFNPAEYMSVAKPLERDIFFDDMRNMDFNSFIKKYASPRKGAIIRGIKSKIRRILNELF